MKKFGLFLAFLVLFGRGVQAKVVDVAYFELENGLKTVVIENHKAPVILQMLYYKTGSVNDPKGKGGTAHLLEHLMFRGTKNVPDKEFNRLTDEFGAESNAYTTFEETGYYEFSDISKLELMMALEADRMVNLTISPEAFAKERDIVFQERMQRFESNPTTYFYEMMQKNLWQNSPKANSVSGSAEEISALELNDVQTFYEKWYTPQNALLVLSGDITPDEAKKVVQKYYGPIKAKETAKPVAISKPKANKTDIMMAIKNVTEPRFVSYIRLEPKTFSLKEIVALELFLEYLTGDDTSFLYDKLVYKDKTLLSVDVGVDYDDDFGGKFALYAIPVQDFGLEKLKQNINEALSLGLKDLDEAKLTQVKNKVLSSVIYALENPESAARFVGGLALSGCSSDEIQNYDEMINSVCVDDVLNVWQKVGASDVVLNGYLTGDEK